MKQTTRLITTLAFAAILLAPATAFAATEDLQLENQTLWSIVNLLQSRIGDLTTAINNLNKCSLSVPSPTNSSVAPQQSAPVASTASPSIVAGGSAPVAAAAPADTTGPQVWGGGMISSQSLFVITDEPLDATSTKVMWAEGNGNYQVYDTDLNAQFSVDDHSSLSQSQCRGVPLGENGALVFKCGGYRTQLTFSTPLVAPVGGQYVAGAAQVWIYDTSGNRTTLPLGAQSFVH